MNYTSPSPNVEHTFTFLIPFKGTSKEQTLAKRTLPVILELCPSEIVFGIDHSTDTSVLESILHENGFENYKMLIINNDGWKMQLCKVMWDGITKSQNDRICIINIDELVNPTLLEGCDVVGHENIVLQSAQGKPYRGTFGLWWRYRNWEKNIRNAPEPFKNGTGVFWVYRPWLFDCVDQTKYSEIYNGSDGFIYYSIDNNARYEYIISRKTSHELLDMDNADLSYRMFMLGVYWHANNRFRYKNRILIRMHCVYRSVRLYSLAFYKGCRYAEKHPNSDAVSLAKSSSYMEYLFYGNTLIE